MRYLPALLSLCLLACVGSTEPAAASSAGAENTRADSALADCAGTWNGVGVQQSGPWSIELALAPIEGHGRCGTIEYPSLGCGGEVVDCAIAPGGGLTMREVYTHGFDACAPPGAIGVTCGARGTASEGHMAWRWDGEGGPVTTELTRR